MDVFITKAYTLIEIFSINDALFTKHRSNFPQTLLPASSFEKEIEKYLSFEMHHYKYDVKL